MWLNQDSLARSLTYAASTPEVPSTYIHSFPSPESPKNILLLILERIAKNISVFPCEINAQVILLLPLAILSQEMSALKKKKRYEEIKRGKCPEPRKKRKSEMRGKNGQVSDSRIRGTRYLPERKEKEEHLILLIKFQKARKVCIPSKEQK